MIKQFHNKRYNKLLSYRNNYFTGGGPTSSVGTNVADNYGGWNNPVKDWSGYTSNATAGLPYSSDFVKSLGTFNTNTSILSQKPTLNIDTSKLPTSVGGISALKSGALKSGALNGVISAAGSAVGGAIGGGLESGAGKVMNGLSNIASAIPGPWGKVASAGLKIVGGLTNRMFGTKFNTANIKAIEQETNKLNNFQSDANSFDTLSKNWGTAALGADITDDAVGSAGWFAHGKIADKANQLRASQAQANAFVENSLLNNAENLNEDTLNNLESNYAAYGGFLNRYDDMANRYDGGGYLNTHGVNFSNGLTYINEGGSHESNPYEGVPMGIGDNGKPNLVEEGEAIYNDYVFSNRLTVPKAVRSKYKLRGNKKLTFADAVKQLSKGATERPNDPISQETLHEIMSDLAQTQEGVRETQNVGNEYSHGGLLGNLYDGEGSGGQLLSMNNNTPGLNFGDSSFTPYDKEGNIDWNIMYGENSPYMKRRQYVLDNWNSEEVRSWLSKYVEGINSYNKNRDGYTPMTVKDITREVFKNRTYDKSWGGMHAGIDYAGDPSTKKENRYFLRSKDANGNLTVTPMEVTPWEGFADKGQPFEGQTFAEAFPKYAFKGKQERPIDNGTIYTDYYYDENKSEEEKKKEDLPPLDLGTSDESLRYAPVAGLSALAVTDAMGVTNKPDYSEAAMLQGASSGSYKPVGWRPVGNMLTYKPFDRDFYTNKLSAEAGAARRAIANQSGGNSGRAIAGILAADYNAQNQLGELFRKAEEYNLEQRQKVEDFNRATNMANSEGMLKADMANQSAYANARDLAFKGVASAAEMMQKERQAADAAKSANLSGLFQTIGDIGYENRNMNMVRRLAETGALGAISEGHPEWWYLASPSQKKAYRKSQKNSSTNKQV